MGKLGGTASAEIHAALDVVWALIADVARAPQWQGHLDALTPLEHDDDGRPVLVETETDAKVRLIKSKVRFEYFAPARLRWSQVQGDLKSLVGSWDLEALDGNRTRATYQLEGDPGRMLGMLIRGPVEGRLREVLVAARPGELKAAIEGT